MTADSSSGSPRTFDRRAFLCVALGAAAAASGLAGGCTLPPRSFRAPRGRSIRIPLASYPELERDGGTVKVFSPEVSVVFVRREPDGRYSAVSGICTHQGCTVAPSGDGFRCPCHGSTYDRAGANTGGPARLPLERFRAAREGDAVVLILQPEKRGS